MKKIIILSAWIMQMGLSQEHTSYVRRVDINK